VLLALLKREKVVAHPFPEELPYPGENRSGLGGPRIREGAHMENLFVVVSNGSAGLWMLELCSGFSPPYGLYDMAGYI
jgi:hypothetical protein